MYAPRARGASGHGRAISGRKSRGGGRGLSPGPVNLAGVLRAASRRVCTGLGTRSPRRTCNVRANGVACARIPRLLRCMRDSRGFIFDSPVIDRESARVFIDVFTGAAGYLRRNETFPSSAVRVVPSPSLPPRRDIYTIPLPGWFFAAAARNGNASPYGALARVRLRAISLLSRIVFRGGSIAN